MDNRFLLAVKDMTFNEAQHILQKYDSTEFSEDAYIGCGCLIPTDFTGKRVKNGEYVECTFDGNSFQFAGTAGTRFEKCKFISCNINGSNMQFCDFSNSTFCNNTEKNI